MDTCLYIQGHLGLQYSIHKHTIHIYMYFLHIYLFSRGRILGRNWDKSLKSFPLCYSQPPLLTDFTPPTRAKCGLKLVWNVNNVWRPQIRELSRLCPETSTKLYVHEFGFSFLLQTTRHYQCTLSVQTLHQYPRVPNDCTQCTAFNLVNFMLVGQFLYEHVE